MCFADEWHRARSAGELRPPSLTLDGFVHLSRPDQVHLPANRLFPGREDLLLLFVDPGRLTARIEWEPGVPTDPDSMLFPHLYGPLPVSAVTDVVDYRPDSTGRFAPLPPDRFA
ncbi:DUF952 domain-containing protein [Antrihabitans sp. YC2-6]|uniref:DUF952 domain-containing protein n=1 Tax=Antrihabitans sp. YC2-6 TaxID=2799498 RepID=UPI0018F51541|nr:DUF952 domain-containing protein [Antrihabitans sp. YC2-6]MBJ8345060.1 DUF952 domain-containing protein [Antrihabitans sp. YC2-6]